MLLTDDKASHLSHLILRGLKEGGRSRILQGDEKALREIKRTITDEIKSEEDIDEAVRMKLSSYSRPIYEGSPEWEVLYSKFYKEETDKRKRP